MARSTGLIQSRCNHQQAKSKAAKHFNPLEYDEIDALLDYTAGMSLDEFCEYCGFPGNPVGLANSMNFVSARDFFLGVGGEERIKGLLYNLGWHQTEYQEKMTLAETCSLLEKKGRMPDFLKQAKEFISRSDS